MTVNSKKLSVQRGLEQRVTKTEETTIFSKLEPFKADIDSWLN